MLIFFPHPPGTGGPGSFQSRFETALKELGWKVGYLSQLREWPDVLFIVGGSRRLFDLWRYKIRGVPIIYRLDGLSWIHRKRWLGMKRFVEAEIRNGLMKLIHGYFADEIVYQSRFVQRWWDCHGWRRRESWAVIPNGVDQSVFMTPFDDSRRTPDHPDVICVEGHLDYSPYAVAVLNNLAEMLGPAGISVRVYGGFADPSNRERLSSRVDYRGTVAREEIQHVYRDGIYLSLDVNAACPNTVIEAMSSGLPVVGFDTGALAELVPGDCGRIVDFGGDPWKLDAPKLEPLVSAILEVANDYDRFSKNARNHAEENFDIRQVTARYIEVIEKAVGRARGRR